VNGLADSVHHPIAVAMECELHLYESAAPEHRVVRDETREERLQRGQEEEWAEQQVYTYTAWRRVQVHGIQPSHSMSYMCMLEGVSGPLRPSHLTFLLPTPDAQVILEEDGLTLEEEVAMEPERLAWEQTRAMANLVNMEAQLKALVAEARLKVLVANAAR